MSVKRIYHENHGILERDYLDFGHEVRDEIDALDMPDGEKYQLLMHRLSLVRARIPRHFWEPSGDYSTSNRSTWRELVKFYENAQVIRNKGLGLTLIGTHSGNRTQSLYIVGREVVIRGYSCFITYFDEFVYFQKEAWTDDALKSELAERFKSDFLFIVEIPEVSEISETIKRDLLALCLLRLNKGLPIIFSINMGLTSLDQLAPQSFIGRLVLPFAPVNKPLIVDDIGSINDSHQAQWRQVDAS